MLDLFVQPSRYIYLMEKGATLMKFKWIRVDEENL